MTRWIAFLTGLILSLSAASAQAAWRTSYTFTTNFGPGSPLMRIMLIEQGDFWSSQTWAFSVPGEGTHTIDNPFDLPGPASRALHIGIVQDLPFDAPGQKHMVLLLDDTAADLSEHIAWGTLFRNTLEEDLIAALELATSGQPFEVIQPGLDFINEWANGDAENGILGPGGIPHSAWFTVGGSFTVMAWSDGTVYGSGTSETFFEPNDGDLDGDDDVDYDDWNEFKGRFGQGCESKGYLEAADLDNDCDIDCDDLALFRNAWPQTIKPTFPPCDRVYRGGVPSHPFKVLETGGGLQQLIRPSDEAGNRGPTVYNGPISYNQPTATGDTGACGVGMMPVLGAGFGACVPWRRCFRRRRAC